MIIFPAIDLIDGKVVRLQRGERSRMDVYSDDPRTIAKQFRASGATWIHVVDLSAAFGEDSAACAANARALEEICSVPDICVDAGGGVRSLADIERLLNLGVSRVAVGTALVRDTQFAREAACEFGEHLCADIAGKAGEVRISGWRENASRTVDDLVAQLVDLGYRHLVFTDVNRDGMQTGIDVDTYQHIAGVAGFPVIASGGIAHLSDLEALAALGNTVIEGAICGRALYEHAFTLEEALALSHAQITSA